MTDELNFDFNDINLDLLLPSSPPKKVECKYDICMTKEEFPLEYSSASGGRNKQKSLELAKRINEADFLLTKIQDLEKQKVKLEQQLVDFQKSANEVQKMYIDEKAQHEKILIELKNYKDKYYGLDSEMANNQFKYEQMQANFDEEKKRPYSYDDLALKFIKVISKFEDSLHKTDLAVVEEIKQYCLDKNLKIPHNTASSSNDGCSSPKKRKIRCAKIKKQEQSTQCSLPSSSLENKEYKEMCSQSSQCRVEMREQGTQHISTMTTRGTTTRVFIKQHNVGTCFPEPKKPPTVEAILQEISQWNVRRISPIKDLSSEASTMEVKTYNTVGTCTWLCNIRRKVDFLPKKISRPASCQYCQNIKQEIETPISSPIPKQASGKVTEQSVTTEADLSSKSIENINASNTKIFENLWQIFGKMVRGLLQHNNTEMVSYSNNFHSINQQQFHDWLLQLYENTHFNENDTSLNSLKNQVLNGVESKSPLLRETKTPNESTVKENPELNEELTPTDFLESPQLDCESIVKPEARRINQRDVEFPLPPTTNDTQIMIPSLSPNRSDNVKNKVQNSSVKKVKQKRKMKKEKKSDVRRRHFKLLKESPRYSELNAVDFLASLRVFHSYYKASNDKLYESTDAINEGHQKVNKREAFAELFGESDDEECFNKINQTVITKENKNQPFNQLVLNRNSLNSNPDRLQVVSSNSGTLNLSPILMDNTIANVMNSNIDVHHSPLHISPISDLILTKEEEDNLDSKEIQTGDAREDIVLRNIINRQDSKMESQRNDDFIKNIEHSENANIIEETLNDNSTNSSLENDLEVSEEETQEKDINLKSLLTNATTNDSSTLCKNDIKKLNDLYLTQSQICTSYRLNSDNLEDEETEKDSEEAELVIDEEITETFEDNETKVPGLINNSTILFENNKTLDSTKLSNLFSSSLYEEMMTDSMSEVVNDLVNESTQENTTVHSPLLTTVTRKTATITIPNQRKRLLEDGTILVNLNKREKNDILNNVEFSEIIGKYTNITANKANVELAPLSNSQKAHKEYNDIENKPLIDYSTHNISLEFFKERSSELNKQCDSDNKKYNDSASLASCSLYETMKINNNEMKSEKINLASEAVDIEATSHTTLKPTIITLNNLYDTSSLGKVQNNNEILFGEDGDTLSNCTQAHTENMNSFDIDDSPQSPLPSQLPYSLTSPSSASNNNLCIKEPIIIPLNYIISNANYTKQRNKTKNSLLDKLIDNYDNNIYKTLNRMRYAKLQPNDEALKERVIEQLHDFCYTDNFSNGNMMASQLIKRIQAITTKYDHIYKAFVVIASNAPPSDTPEKDLPSVIQERPPRHLTNVLQRLHYILKFFHYLESNFCLNLMTHIEHLLFNIKQKEHFNLTQCLHLTQLYLLCCELQKNHFEKHPARRFIVHCLYYYNLKSVLLIHEVLMWCPTVLPPREERSYNRSDVIINVIKYLLMNYKYDMENTQLRGKSLLSKLRYEYHYQPFQPTQTDIITNLMEKLKANKTQDITYAFALICKRMPPDKAKTIVLDQHLIPLANQYYEFARINISYDTRIAAVLNVVAVIVKPFPLQTDVTSYLNLFARFLITIDRPIVQEYALRSILSLQRFGYVNCYKLLHQHTTTCLYSLYQNRTIEAMLKSFIYRKSKRFWKRVQLQMKE